MTRLRDQVVWITGASAGIGEALAIEAAHRGARLVLSARRASELKRVRAACVDPSRVSVLPLDLLDCDIEAVRATAEGLQGPIDVLVNNAGASSRGTVLESDVEVYRKIMELDFFAPLALTKSVLPGMVARRHGHVVMIGSVVSRIGTPKRSAYASAKHALAGYTECARAELWREGIRFSLVMPGFVRTAVTKNALGPDGLPIGVDSDLTENGIATERCAQAICDGVERNAEEIVVGGIETQMLRLKRWAPPLSSFVIKRVRSS